MQSHKSTDDSDEENVSDIIDSYEEAVSSGNGSAHADDFMRQRAQLMRVRAEAQAQIDRDPAAYHLLKEIPGLKRRWIAKEIKVSVIKIIVSVGWVVGSIATLFWFYGAYGFWLTIPAFFLLLFTASVFLAGVWSGFFEGKCKNF